MNILVTGGAGFIGSHLIERLMELNDKVICLDNFDDFYDPRIKRVNLKQFEENQNFRLIEGDIRDESLVKKILSDNIIDFVYHIAARAGVRPSIQHSLLYQDVNIKGTIILLEALKEHPVPFVFSSSSSVYGNSDKVPFSEKDAVDDPISPYAATKKAGELLCHTYHHLYHLPILCLRFFTVYGPRQRPEMAIHKFTRMIFEDRKIPVFGNGNSKRDYTYIDDIVDGLISARDLEFKYEILNLGESQTVELSYLIELLEKNIGRKAKIDWLPDQPGDVKLTYANIEKAQSLLNYSPKVNIEKGIAFFVRWYQKMFDVVSV